MSLLKRGRDNLLNGGIFGMGLGIGIIFADEVIDFVTKTIPENWLVFESISPGISIPIYIVGIFGILGYLADRF